MKREEPAAVETALSSTILSILGPPSELRDVSVIVLTPFTRLILISFVFHVV